MLLGLLERDFRTVTICPVQTLAAHIRDTGVCLPEEIHPFIMELHEVGVLLLLGGKNASDLVLNIPKLTNEVHERLFSDHRKAHSTLQTNTGIITEDTLKNILPPYITSEHLVHLQYCQQIKHADISVFPSLDKEDSTKSFLFFPALCNVDKKETVSWEECTDNSFSIGWLAKCTDIYDYFPPRFLHVLLLRLVFCFALPVSAPQASSEYNCRCTMWKRGVHWLTKEGVDCMVELVTESQLNKGVVVLTRSRKQWEEDCITIFNNIVHCVMEAKAEFCHSIKPQFFLLDSTAEADYLSKDNMFSLSDVKDALASPRLNNIIISVSGRGKMECSKLTCMRRLTHWNSLFPMDFSTVLHLLRDIVKELYELGEGLGASRGVLQAIEVNFPFDVERRRRELVKWWLSSSPDPPCWWHLVQALKKINNNSLAEKIRKEHGKTTLILYC